MSSKTFDLDAGALCLDFANTVDWHASELPQDRLADYSDLLAWGEAAGAMLAERAQYLRPLAKHQPESATSVFERAIQLREAIYRIFSFLAASRNVALDDLAFLNEVLGKSMAHLRIISSFESFSWDWSDTSELIPAFIIIIAIPFTFSIAIGIALGFITYPLIKLLSGRVKEVHPLIWVVAVLFSLKFFFE